MLGIELLLKAVGHERYSRIAKLLDLRTLDHGPFSIGQRQSNGVAGLFGDCPG